MEMLITFVTISIIRSHRSRIPPLAGLWQPRRLAERPGREELELWPAALNADAHPPRHLGHRNHARRDCGRASRRRQRRRQRRGQGPLSRAGRRDERKDGRQVLNRVPNGTNLDGAGS